MNRGEREEAKRSQQERDMEAQVRHYHLALFPEEYDEIYDSGVEASERKRGINPMSQAYQNEVNIRRAALGFGPYVVGGVKMPVDGPANLNTQGWVQHQLSIGNQEQLDQLVTKWFDDAL